MPAARATTLPVFFTASRNRSVLDSRLARRPPAGAESPGQRPQPVVVCRSSIRKFGNHFCTILSAFAVRFRCLSTTYHQELHQWCKPNVSPPWTLDFGPCTLDFDSELETRNPELCRPNLRH